MEMTPLTTVTAPVTLGVSWTDDYACLTCTRCLVDGQWHLNIPLPYMATPADVQRIAGEHERTAHADAGGQAVQS